MHLHQDLPLTDGKLVELQAAIAIRPQIKSILEREYLNGQIQLLERVLTNKLKELKKHLRELVIYLLNFKNLQKEI